MATQAVYTIAAYIGGVLGSLAGEALFITYGVFGVIGIPPYNGRDLTTGIVLIVVGCVLGWLAGCLQASLPCVSQLE